MSQVYSHSRISTFEQCPLKFKYQYIDKIETEVEQSIEAFMGSLVHETLEKLYVDLKFSKKNELKDLLAFFNDLWKKDYNDKILIVRKEYTPENFRQMGEKFITAYFESHAPFDDAITIATEKHIHLMLDRYELQGYIDRLAVKGETYEIHDYKTSSSLPLKEYLDEDRQLALYSIAVRNDYADAKKVKLIWHFLAFNKDIVLEKTEEQLEKLKKETIAAIAKIESAREYPAVVSSLCDWCEFRSICPKWSHLVKTQDLPVNEYLKDAGVVLANKYAAISQEKADTEKKLELLKDAIFAYCAKNNVDDLFGSDVKLSVRTYNNFKFPGKDEPLREDLISMLKKLGVYEQVAELDAFKLSRLMKDRKLPDEFIRLLQNFASEDRVRRIYLNKKYSF